LIDAVQWCFHLALNSGISTLSRVVKTPLHDSNILKDIFGRARGNAYLHHCLKTNTSKTGYYEQEIEGKLFMNESKAKIIR
jgi:hypothetical protein